MPSRTSPSVRRRILAARLKALRIAKNVNRKQAADHLGVAETTITRIENTTGKATIADVRSLLELYGVTDEGDREFLLQLARDAGKRDWYQKHKPVIPPQFETFFGLETESEELRSFELGFIPGLLQTADYYRAYLMTAPTAFPETSVDRMVEFRLARQERMLTADGPRLWMILDEAVLRRPVGGTAVMRDQLAQLRVRRESPNLTLQVYPFAAGAHQAMDGSFTIIQFPEKSHTDVVYLESQTDSRYLEAEDVVDRYNLVFNHLRANALSTEQTAALLTETERNIQ
ncbi:helix-turn-helix domain-containing protein [Nonomuraea typhae]|uniref:Helix-turn-helix domain-containing protein n=1 Tax=Nonomuraea typhae TaxID=2603600 RepID=A0ABW7YJW6_9ACTN